MSLTVYRYDGSFDGLLSAFAEAMAREVTPPEFSPDCDGSTPSLFGSRASSTCPAAAAALLARLEAAGGAAVPRALTQAYLAETPGLERPLYGYCCLTLERRQCVDAWLSHPAVAQVQEAARRVSREAHRFQGLLRFMETATGVFYAPYEPDHNITVPLSRYFATRLGAQQWLIHDCRRDLAVFWDGRDLQPARLNPKAPGSPDGGPPLSAGERAVQELWRTYHRRSVIAGRGNPRLQRQFMPRRYWRHLVEMQPEAVGTAAGAAATRLA